MSQLSTEPLSVPAWTLTSHAMLVPWGLFAQHLGLIEALESVPIDQRRRDYKPQTKLIEFLVAILAGCAYLQDISRAPQPLDQDIAVAQAWQQAGWADYSGVSRTLKACTIVNFMVATGEIGTVSYGPTRNEADFLNHVQHIVEAHPDIRKWHFIVDNLNTHCSESLVNYVAEESDIADDLGIKGKSGVLQSMKSRAAFLTDTSHHIVFHYTPKHASWMNQPDSAWV